MQRTTLVLLAAIIFAFTGCANMTPTEQRVLSGGAIGAGGGVVIGALAGAPAIGAAAGAGAGALGGLVYDQVQKSR
jgi:osmotically inducible lipoprotein OsmB